MSDDELIDLSATYVLDDESDETKTLEQLADWAQRKLLERPSNDADKSERPVPRPPEKASD